MRTLPTTMIQLLAPFAPLFSERLFQHVQVLLAGTILAPGKRTVASALRAAGLEEERRFCRYHRVLNRAVWSSQKASRVLLGLLVKAFMLGGGGPLVVGIDETLERRQGKMIVAKGIYRDPVRSSDNHFVKTSALRWVCLMLLAPIPWPLGFGHCPFFRRWLLLNATQERARKATQEACRVGLAIALAGEALASGTRDRDRSRRWICFFEASRPLPEAQEEADHFHHPLTAGCCPLRTSPATLSWPDRTAPAQG